jgi:uncharacterized phage protein (TIGR02216 family)
VLEGGLRMNLSWRSALRLAALRLAIPPEAFWRLSLAEWRALTEIPAGPVLTRQALDALIARFPDDQTP